VIVDQPRLIAGRYRIDQPLGSGGMGTVYAGHDLRLDRDVAVKVLRDDLTADPSLRRRFAREARAVARVSHPNVVAVFDTGDDGAHDTFIVMERLTGRTLGHELRDGPLDEARLRAVADAVLGALEAAHAEGLVHRDVKPGNILLAADGTLKVGDFGIATTLDAGDSTTRVPMGTPAYTAPERLRGLAATERSDLYSLGVVLYEAAAGVRPFTGAGAVAVAEAVVGGAHTSLREQRPDLPVAFVAAIERALATEPTDRFADAAEMRAALAGATADAAPATVAVAATVPLPRRPSATAMLPPPARSVPSTPGRRPRRARPTRTFVAAAVLLALVAAIAVGLVLGRRDGGPTVPSSTTPTVSAPAAPSAGGSPPLPAALAHALDRLQQATQP
jgi:serine/threonine protein kinase